MYNNLTEFSKTISTSTNPMPIRVWFDREGIESPLVFEYKGISVRLRLPIYYCLDLEELEGKGSYLVPEDYNNLMQSLSDLIYDERVLNDRGIVLSPENMGFDVYAIDIKQFQKGLEFVRGVRFVSGSGWWFRLKTKFKYGIS